jgi:uncharacterized protein
LKIQEATRINRNDSNPSAAERSSTHPAYFQKMLHAYSKELTKDHLNQILQDIDQQGQKLIAQQNFHELRKYKNLVQQFMDEVSKNGIALKKTETWDPNGGSKTLKTVQVLDQKLIDLTNHVLYQQSSGLTLLERIGEIKGLLINLYT